MAKAKKQQTTTADADAVPPLEEALAELQEIVSDLEDGTLGLEESMRRFEKGIELLRGCYRVLEQAEQRIDVLTGTDADGNPTTTPFDVVATVQMPEETSVKRKRRKPTDQPQAEEPESDEDDSEATLF